MIDDAAWLTYPLHLAVGILKTFVYGFLFIVAIFLYLGIWMMTAHDSRAEEIKNFASEQTVYRVDLANNSVTIAKAGYAVDKEDFEQAFDGCEGTRWATQEPDLLGPQLAGREVRRVPVRVHRCFAQRCGFAVRDLPCEARSAGRIVPLRLRLRCEASRCTLLSCTSRSCIAPTSRSWTRRMLRYNWFTGMCMTDCTDC